MIFPSYWKTTPHSIMQSIEPNGTLTLEESCQGVPEIEEYLEILNKANKPNNILCNFSGDLTTMSKLIVCQVMHGVVKAQIYWAENEDECIRIKTNLEKQNKK